MTASEDAAPRHAASTVLRDTLAAASVVTLAIGVARYRSVARDLAAFRTDMNPGSR